MSQHPAFLLIDRTAVLFCGVAAGVAIGLAFAPQLQGLIAADGPIAAVPDQPPAAPEPEAAPAPVLAQPPAGLARAVAENRPFRIGVFGDSFGDGLWAGLYNQLPRREAFQVLRYSEQSTGFTRYRQTNLAERLAEQLGEGPVDVAVISFGANDTQGVWAGGKAHALLSEGWKAEIGQRVQAYVQGLQAQGAAVVWIGLPVMRDSRYDGQIAGLNSFFAGLMAELGGEFIDTRALAADEQGGYSAYLPGADGQPFLARASDGIHMSMKGYQRLTAELAAQLRAHAEAARRGEAVPASLVPPPASLPPPRPKSMALSPAAVDGPAPATVPAEALPPAGQTAPQTQPQP